MNQAKLEQIVWLESGNRKTWKQVQCMGIAANITATLRTKGMVDCETVYDFLVVDKCFDCLLSYLQHKHNFAQHQLKIVENSGLYYKFTIDEKDASKISVGKLIGIFESVKEMLQIAYYSVNQTTMEQIFQRISKESEDDLVKLSQNLSNKMTSKSRDDFGRS